MIQKAWRKFTAKKKRVKLLAKEAAHRDICARIIQATFRTYLLRKFFLRVQHSTRVIQHWWRNILEAQRARVAFVEQKNAAIILQSHVRRRNVQRMLERWNKAAATIQASFRGYVQRKHYLSLLQNISVIQTHWRSTLRARECRNSFLQMRGAAITIQSHCRKMRVQKMISHQCKAAIKIQAGFRSYRERKQYLSLKRSVCIFENYWTATLYARQARKKFVAFRQAIIALQSNWRRKKVEETVAHQKSCAVKIQAMFRCYSQRKKFLSIKKSVEVIEYYWQAVLVARMQRSMYLAQRNAVIILQSHVRRWKVQKVISHQNRSATKIQAFFRMHSEKASYLKLKISARAIQCYWRATLLARQCRREYLNQQRAAIVCQSFYRRKVVQRMIQYWHRTATTIQSHYRTHSQRKKYLAIKNAACVIQLYWRATQESIKCRETYLQQRRAAILLQAHFRRRRVEKMLVRQHFAAGKIQAAFRGYHQRKQYALLKRSVSIIEKYWLATLDCRQSRNTFLELKRAAITIQSHVRRRIVQRKMALQHRAATTIQAGYRSHIERKRFLSLKQSAEVIQCYWKATMMAKKCKSEYLQYRRAVIIIQSHMRRKKVQRMIAQWNSAATKIQSAHRMYLQRKKYLEMKQSVRAIESYWGATLLARNEKAVYIEKRKAIVLLQSHIRKWQVKKTIAHQNRAATIIQSNYRSYSQRTKYTQTRVTIISLQICWRAILLGRQCRREYIQQRKAVILLQSHMRRRIVQKMMARQHKAASLLQASYKRYTQRKTYLRMKHSVDIIAYYWTATLLAREYRRSYLLTKQAIITIQSHYRRWAVQREMATKHQSATLIQAGFRQYVQRKKYLALKHSVLVIEQYWSATLAARGCRTEYLKQRRAIITLQANVRRRKVQKMITHQNLCAIKIQSMFRCYAQKRKYLAIKVSVKVIECYLKATLLARQCRQEYLTLRQAAIICQSHVRTRQVQKMINHWHESATKVQAAYRSYSQQKKYLKTKRAVNVVQVHWRAITLGRQQREAYLNQKRAAIIIQAHARRRRVEKTLAKQHRAATLIQSMYRKHTAQTHYSQLKHSVDVITNYWRATLLARQQRNEYLAQRQAIILLQSRARGMKTRNTIARYHKAATTIQASYRCYKQRSVYLSTKASVSVIGYYWRATLLARKDRQTFLNKKHATITLQSHFRRSRVQRMIASKHRAATKIQSIYRCYSRRREYLSLYQSVRTLQCYWRATLLAAQCRKEFIKQRSSIVLLQAHVRGILVRNMLKKQHQAATAIQTMFRCHYHSKHFAITKRSTCTIQYYWRATLVSRKARFSYLRQRSAIITLQSHFRRKQVQDSLAKQHRAATVIQAVYRAYTERKRYLLTVQSAKVIRYYWRATLEARKCRSNYLSLRESIIVLQSHFRRRRVQGDIRLWQKSATMIQKTFRGYQQKKRYWRLKQCVALIQCHWRATVLSRQCRSAYVEKKRAAITLQSHFRRWQVVKTISSMHSSATVIQAIVRGFVHRSRYIRLRNKTLYIQKRWRSLLEAKRERTKYLCFRQSTVIFQANARRWLLQRNMSNQRTAAIKIQASVKCHLQRKCYTRMKESAGVIQYWWRAILLVRKQRQLYLKKRSAIITLQSCVRRLIVQRRLSNLNASARAIQSWYRCVVARRRYQELKGVVTMIQRARRAKKRVRELREAKRLEDMTRAAVVIQRHWRSYQEVMHCFMHQ